MLMLDTNAISALARGRDTALTKLVGAQPFCISVLVEAELRYGLARRPINAGVRRIVEGLLANVDIRAWNSVCARQYGVLRATLEARGLTLAPLDLLIASHALAEQRCMLVTADRAFTQVPGLQVLDWTADPAP